MKKTSIEQIVEVVHGTTTGSTEQRISGVTVDSRTVRPGDLFVALKGEKTDGHQYIDKAFEKGAAACMVERLPNKRTAGPLIVVENGLKAIQQLARYNREALACKVLAVTGSSGKTTTKDLIAGVLSVKHRVVHTTGNQNNELGLPLTLLRGDEETDVFVVEMGMRGLGQIKELADIARPDLAVITNIGTAHLELLHSRENIFKAKTEIFSYFTKDQVGIVNGDDDYLKNIRATNFPVYKVGIKEEGLDLRCIAHQNTVNGLRMEIEHAGEIQKYRFLLPGVHNVYNSLSAIMAGLVFDLTPEQIQQGMNRYQGSENRMEIQERASFTVINDAYNANVQSMESAIDVLKNFHNKKQTKIAVLGDMLELGDEQIKYHQEIGKKIARSGIDFLIAYGELASHYIEGAKQNGFAAQKCHHAENKKEIAAFIQNNFEEATILLKGSRAMALEEILQWMSKKGSEKQ
ncbi:MAG TPA: UDP-N-acetylmuramoyl-tripeptide--D-alanyl-D-alanine ligase [Eubacteriaceae bacterium]|nr:UDP-N-acetylmuramoyl-tripeptide--D-alanyl-D-alanine ligase [Eubacteriaceae bacterium]